MSIQSNIGGGHCIYLSLVVIPTAYSLLTNTPFVFQFNPVNLLIHIAATRKYQEELNLQYEKTYEDSTKHEEWNKH